MKFLIYLDSRGSVGPRASRCNFNLNQPIIGGSKCKVVSFVFANTLHNVNSSNNELKFSSVTVAVPYGYYTSTQLVNYINTQLNASPAFTTGHTIPPGPTPLIWDGELVQWVIGDNQLQPSSMYSVFGLDVNLSYQFSFLSTLFLASPVAIALNSPALTGNQRFISCAEITSPFYVQHVDSAHNEVERSDASINQQSTVNLSHLNISQLQVFVTDPYSNRELRELSFWSAILEIDTD